MIEKVKREELIREKGFDKQFFDQILNGSDSFEG